MYMRMYTRFSWKIKKRLASSSADSYLRDVPNHGGDKHGLRGATACAVAPSKALLGENAATRRGALLVELFLEVLERLAVVVLRVRRRDRESEEKRSHLACTLEPRHT